jgi:CubicO group peptidase (beta-lactamase class C family)
MKTLIFTIFLAISLYGKDLPVNIKNLEKALEYSISTGGQTFLVMYDGEIIYEKYSNGGSPEKLQWLASGSKSFIGIVAVAAVEDGLIKLDDRVCEIIDQWKNDPLKSKITYRHLLTLTGGFAPLNVNDFKNYTWKDLTERPLISTPGERFRYGGVSLNIFAYALQLKLKNETFENYLKRRIIEPLNIKLQWIMRCKDGNPQVAGGGSMTARDWAKFGEFVRLNGKYGEKQIIKEELIKECFKGSDANPYYGLTWWLKAEKTNFYISDIVALNWKKEMSNDFIPSDLVAACGAGGQRLYIIPSLKLVIVRQGISQPRKRFSDSEFLKILFGN